MQLLSRTRIVLAIAAFSSSGVAQTIDIQLIRSSLAAFPVAKGPGGIGTMSASQTSTLETILLEASKVDTVPKPDDNEAKLADYFRIASGLLHTKSLGTKDVVLGLIYWRPRADKKVKSPEVETLLDLFDRLAKSAMSSPEFEKFADNKKAQMAMVVKLSKLAREKNRTIELKTVRTLQNGEAEGSLPDINRWSIAFGVGKDPLNKHVVGLNYMFNEWVGITIGHAFGEDKNAKGRFTIGFNFDAGVLSQLLNPKGSSDKEKKETPKP